MEKKNNKLIFTIIAVIVITIFCFAVTPITLQNDTYYSIKIGEHIANNKAIDMKDPFSWHKDLKYTYPHWLYDLLTYFVYSLGGFKGIYVATILLTIILGLTLYFTNVKLSKNRVTSLVLTIGILYMLQDFIAARAQLVTFILFVLTVYFIEQFLETGKKRYAAFLVLIPILIANLHTAVFPFYFVLYLPYIGEFVFYKIQNIGTFLNKREIKKLQKKILKEKDEALLKTMKEELSKLQDKGERIKDKQEELSKNEYKVKVVKAPFIKALIIIFIICLFTGLLTPIKDTPYTYLPKTMKGDTTQNINEHSPLVLTQNVKMMVVIAIFIGILTFTDTKIRLKDLFMLGGLLFLAFYSKRQESIFAIIACGFVLNKLICECVNKRKPNFFTNVEKKVTSIVGSISIIAIVLAMSILIFKPKANDSIVDIKDYPVYASDFILEKLDVNNIRLYNEYNFGSYLLFRGIPVFIDSRADLYTPEFNKDVKVFDDFLDLSSVSLKNVENKLDYYGITHLIMGKNAKLRTFIKGNTDKYTLLYEDDNFCVYERKTIYMKIDNVVEKTSNSLENANNM